MILVCGASNLPQIVKQMLAPKRSSKKLAQRSASAEPRADETGWTLDAEPTIGQIRKSSVGENKRRDSHC